MKVHLSLSAKKPDYRIENEHGVLNARWKYDLLEEEDENYLPEGYDPRKVLELAEIYVSRRGQSHGEALMKEFLNSNIVKKAELVFLDPVPLSGYGDGSDDGRHKNPLQRIEALKRFYTKFGFRSRVGHNRMWLVRKGTIKDSELPT